jgi:hypothetical protein
VLQDARYIVTSPYLFTAYAVAKQRTLARPANLRLRRIESIALWMAAPDRLRPFFSKRPEDRDHSDTSQLLVSSTRDLDRTGGTVAKTDVQ